MHNIFLILALTSPLYFLKTAEAVSKYEKIKTMYIQATAPNSEAFVLKRAVEVGACAEFTKLNPDQSKPQSLVVVTHKISGGGPEFPDQILKGLGFGMRLKIQKNFLKIIKNI